MARLATLKKGDWEAFERHLSAEGLTAEDVLKLNDNPDVIGLMLAAVRQHPAFRLIHGRFTPLADKLEVVKTWPDINPADVDTAFALATENGTIAGYNAEVGKNVHLDAVVTCYRESLPATLLYGRDRMKDTWGDKYSEWTEAYAQGVDEKRVQAIPGAKPFVPNRVVIEVVDFGANWNKRDGTKLKDVQKAQAGQLADFAVLFNASQSPEWVQQMDGTNVPHAIMAALLLSVPEYGAQSHSPFVWRNGGRAKLSGSHVGFRFSEGAMPVFREYKS